MFHLMDLPTYFDGENSRVPQNKQKYVQVANKQPDFSGSTVVKYGYTIREGTCRLEKPNWYNNPSFSPSFT